MAQANQWWSPLFQLVDSDGTHKCGQFTGDGDVDVDVDDVNVFFWVRAGSKLDHTQKTGPTP